MYFSPTGQWWNSYWLAIMWNVWSFDNVKNENDSRVKWWSRWIIWYIMRVSDCTLKWLQVSSTSSVRERLPDNCLLNLSDGDEDTLEQLQSVENTFFSLGNIVEYPTYIFIFILINHRSYKNPTQVKWFLIQI